MQDTQKNAGRQPLLPEQVFNHTTLGLMQQSLQARLEKLWLDTEEVLTLYKASVHTQTLSEKLKTISQDAIHLNNEIQLWRGLKHLLPPSV